MLRLQEFPWMLPCASVPAVQYFLLLIGRPHTCYDAGVQLRLDAFLTRRPGDFR